MEKTYWWRIIIFLVGGAGLIIGYLIFYPFQYGLCVSSEGKCLFSALKKTFAEPLFFLSLSLLTVSPFLFFIRDEIFLKWLRFAIVWFIVTAIFIILAPEYSGGWGANLNPTKESVSIWMGSLFVIISLVFIAREKWKTWKKAV